jgi:putative ABC transport system permease protein
MFRNYWRTAWRMLAKNKGFTIVNIGGLAIGLTACIVILQYVGFERSFDKFHPKAEHIYRVTKKHFNQGVMDDHSAMTFTATGPEMQRAFPEIEMATTVSEIYGSGVVSYGDVKFNEDKIVYADSAFLKMFDFPVIEGNVSNFNRPGTILISASAAKKYFNRKYPIGQMLRVNNDPFLVTGVLKDVPHNSHILFDFLIYTNYNRNWNNYDYYTYLQLKPGTNVNTLQAKFPAFINSIEGMTSKETEFELQPLTNIHLYSHIRNEAEVNGNSRSVYFLLIIAGFILAIAWVNYINLSTARSIRRAKEVGIRKVVGALRPQLIRQFLFESLLINAIAAIVSCIILYFALPYFAELTGKPLSDKIWNTAGYWLLFAAVFIAGTLLSAIYPAFVLSSFKPLTVIKGFAKTSGGHALRKTLVTIQFVATVFLLISTLTVYRQLQYMRSQDLGMNIDQTLVITGPKMEGAKEAYRSFKNEILQLPSVRKLTRSSNVPGKEIWSANPAYLLSAAPETAIGMNEVDIDEDFVDAFKIKLVSGRKLSESNLVDVNDGILLNETASSALGFIKPDDALDRQVVFRGDTLRVKGVIRNYHQESLKSNIDPIIFKLGTSYSDFYSVKLNVSDLNNTIAAIGNKFRNFFPNDPFEFFFLDDLFNRQYQADQQLGQIFLWFACLAILVACLGLFGLASFTITQRTKEVGIRKVLGASMSSLVLLLSREFVQLVLLAFLISMPLAWYSMHLWLEDFAYRIPVGWIVFVVAGGVALFIAAVTVSFQAIKAALANPTKTLRTE